MHYYIIIVAGERCAAVRRPMSKTTRALTFKRFYIIRSRTTVTFFVVFLRTAESGQKHRMDRHVIAYRALYTYRTSSSDIIYYDYKYRIYTGIRILYTYRYSRTDIKQTYYNMYIYSRLRALYNAVALTCCYYTYMGLCVLKRCLACVCVLLRMVTSVVCVCARGARSADWARVVW